MQSVQDMRTFNTRILESRPFAPSFRGRSIPLWLLYHDSVAALVKKAAGEDRHKDDPEHYVQNTLNLRLHNNRLGQSARKLGSSHPHPDQHTK
jgi:hypothetical protein